MTTEAIVGAFPRLRVLVVGDICADRWCTYDPGLCEPSRETGIERVAVTSVEVTPGAGGTVANNLAAMRAGTVTVLGIIGCDGHGWELRQALAARGIGAELLVEARGFATFTYTKLLNAATGAEDRPRVDFVNSQPPDEQAQQELLARLDACVADYDVVIVSDQAETDSGGVVTGRVRARISDIAARHGAAKVVWVDSRLRCELFRNVIVKPNEREAREACVRAFGREDRAGLRRHIGPRPLIVTRGGEGAEVWDDNGVELVPSRPLANPVDICGAGDSFSAAGAMAYAVTGSALDAARLGNLAARVTIGKKGTGTASPDEILAADR